MKRVLVWVGALALSSTAFAIEIDLSIAPDKDCNVSVSFQGKPVEHFEFGKPGKDAEKCIDEVKKKLTVKGGHVKKSVWKHQLKKHLNEAQTKDFVCKDKPLKLDAAGQFVVDYKMKRKQDIVEKIDSAIYVKPPILKRRVKRLEQKVECLNSTVEELNKALDEAAEESEPVESAQ